jgi:hypothetical protein
MVGIYTTKVGKTRVGKSTIVNTNIYLSLRTKTVPLTSDANIFMKYSLIFCSHFVLGLPTGCF